jgi:hypothetical protein
VVDTSVIPAIGMQRQEDCEFKASLGYIAKLPPPKKKKSCRKTRTY